jgi:hypothetical protein
MCVGRLRLDYPDRGARAEYVIDAQEALQGMYTRSSAVGKIVRTRTTLDRLAPWPRIRPWRCTRHHCAFP